MELEILTGKHFDYVCAIYTTISCWINYTYFAALTTSATWLAQIPVVSAELLDAA